MKFRYMPAKECTVTLDLPVLYNTLLSRVTVL